MSESVCSEPCGCWVGGGPTDAWINESVAKKLGWKRIESDGALNGWWREPFQEIAEDPKFPEDTYFLRSTSPKVKDYATDIKAAFELVGKLPEFRLRLIPSDHSDHGLESWGASYWLDGQWREVVSGTAAKAICLAFLDLPSV